MPRPEAPSEMRMVSLALLDLSTSEEIYPV
jgi:hypothetical protein